MIRLKKAFCYKGDKKRMNIVHSICEVHDDRKDPNEYGRPLYVVKLADADGKLNEPGYYSIRKQIKDISLVL